MGQGQSVSNLSLSLSLSLTLSPTLSHPCETTRVITIELSIAVKKKGHSDHHNSVPRIGERRPLSEWSKSDKNKLPFKIKTVSDPRLADGTVSE